MNKEWSDLNKLMQIQLKKSDTFDNGIQTLLELRHQCMNVIDQFRDTLSNKDFYQMPFMNAKGYHSKTIAYSLWHIFRIEDIVLNTLIMNQTQVYFRLDYHKRINSPIRTTGNELKGKEIEDFSKQLDLESLYRYIHDVKENTERILSQLKYSDLKRRFTELDKQHILDLCVVSEDKDAYWLIDYWCNKDIKGLIQMPFSRHWIMHIEASNRIKNKILHNEQK